MARCVALRGALAPNPANPREGLGDGVRPVDTHKTPPGAITRCPLLWPYPAVAPDLGYPICKSGDWCMVAKCPPKAYFFHAKA